MEVAYCSILCSAFFLRKIHRVFIGVQQVKGNEIFIPVLLKAWQYAKV